MTEKFTIQLAREEDSKEIAELIHSVIHYVLSNPSDRGAEGFMSSISQAAISKCINSNDFLYILCFKGTQLVGAAALRDNTHLYHLFVDPEFHRLGVGSKLWRHLKNEAKKADNPGNFTVNSSLFAVPIYAAFGFVSVGEPQLKNGIQFQPMQLSAND